MSIMYFRKVVFWEKRHENTSNFVFCFYICFLNEDNTRLKLMIWTINVFAELSF